MLLVDATAWTQRTGAIHDWLGIEVVMAQLLFCIQAADGETTLRDGYWDREKASAPRSTGDVLLEITHVTLLVAC